MQNVYWGFFLRDVVYAIACYVRIRAFVCSCDRLLEFLSGLETKFAAHGVRNFELNLLKKGVPPVFFVRQNPYWN